MPKVAVGASWLCQLEPEHRLGVTLAPGPTWSRSGCFLQGSSAFLHVWNAAVSLPFAGGLLGARGMLPEPVWPLA